MTDDRVTAAVPWSGGPLVFVDDLATPQLSDDDHHHLARVRRLRPGDEVIVGDGRGGWCAGRFAGHTPEVTGARRRAPRPRPDVGVAFALVKGHKPELVVQKLTELGVDRIVAFVAERSVVRWDEHKAAAAVERFRKVARESAMQSRRAWLPTIEPVATFAEVAAWPGACLADMGGGPPSLAHPLVLVGPEGGWTETERGAGLPTVALGDGVLRAETAAIVAGALLTAQRHGGRR